VEAKRARTCSKTEVRKREKDREEERKRKQADAEQVHTGPKRARKQRDVRGLRSFPAKQGTQETCALSQSHKVEWMCSGDQGKITVTEERGD
jgi:hypothetical protein